MSREPAREPDPVVALPRLEPARQPSQPEPVVLDPPREEPVRQRIQTNARLSAPGERGPGWLSDLLARASRDEGQTDAARRAPTPPPPAPAPAPAPARLAPPQEPLSGISLDGARLIDTRAAEEAWDRYRRGDQNAFSRHIYTGHGPQMFEEIRRRYRVDADFRTTVDRYISEFERILSEANRDDHDDSVTRAYLGSENGKVYTMLAHAAGRLG